MCNCLLFCIVIVLTLLFMKVVVVLQLMILFVLITSFCFSSGLQQQVGGCEYFHQLIDTC